MHELRRLLIGTEQARLGDLERRLEDPERLAEKLADALPDAVTRRAQRDERLAASLAPTFERLLRKSVEKDPDVMRDAVFPILGPAIRKAVAHAIAGLAQSINRTLEQTVTVRSLQWRLQSWRTGRPFAEIVMANSFVYRIEQVFLVHRETGLLLLQVAAPGCALSEPEAVSSMLTALGDFAHDSLDAAEHDSLEQLRVGELSVLVEAGSRALLCATVRGTPKPDLRQKLAEALEAVHAEKATALAEFHGDVDLFESVHPVLEACLVEQRLERADGGKKMMGPIALAAAAAVVLGLLTWSWLAGAGAARLRQQVTAALAAEPGVLVVESGVVDGRVFARGLADPLARPPAAVLAAAGLPVADVGLAFDVYAAPHAPFVRQRATVLLQPPPTVALEVEQGRLLLRGRASAEWLARARQLGVALPGVAAVVDRDCRVLDASALEVSQQAACAAGPRFAPGSAAVDGRQREHLAQAAVHLRDATATARALGAALRIGVVAYGDASETEVSVWRRLASRRAEAAIAALRPDCDGGAAWEARVAPFATRAGTARHVAFALELQPTEEEER